ncbi:GH92 family glycosyl hydrolase [Aliiglaciecola sp. CAU 1673]|uniref:GH92 family glycosyl hydrolase n=1 Tax=Aliiglaciecola sp. CAU 1673 TaxID=3032595 RepID=UPI0023DB6DA1|nr:GH92 family glycosyl hydrolase [Aliiglaciecola sp. CAU 1673]MDF2178613.1 GH92 family glycosyl hydrolase [Aliiglaciecola sp. CAU 1673]
MNRAIRIAGLTVLLLLHVSCSGHNQAIPAKEQRAVTPKDPLDYVNPFIGTGGKGKTFPGATAPHGMVQLSPDNGRGGWDWIAGYFYPDNIIAGFSHTHLSGTGAGDLYDISFMPLIRPFKREQTEGGPPQGTIVSHFSHEQEQASPGFYQVYLEDYGIEVALTASTRSGLQRYRYPTDAQTGVVRLDLGYSRNWDKTVKTYMELRDSRTITGYRYSSGWAPEQRVYFASRLSKPITKWQFERDGELLSAEKAQGVILALEMDFALVDNQELLVHTALSSVSMDNALANLKDEGDDIAFETLHQATRQAWRQELGKIRVEASADNLTQFYTAMYHASLAPRIFSDVDGRYKGPDGSIQQSTGAPRYEFFSLWDTFRALHPWKTLIDTKRTREMMDSLMAHYKVAGRLPVWIFQGNETDMMMGYHSVPVLVDAYLKGLTDIPGQAILQAALHSAQQQDFGIGSYQRLGYVPYEERSWNVSLTLEYAFDDYAIAKLAAALGETEIEQRFLTRAQHYRRHFDPASGFMRARDASGQFREPFDPDAYHPEDYCEANAWQYSFFVPHDVPGMMAMMGGPKAFAAKLDEMFARTQNLAEFPEWISGAIGQYVHGNEPSHHVPYLYHYAGQGHKTQALVRRIMDELYSTAPDGLAGNEDAGQMSAWYLFSALGFYPLNPVSGEYVLGSPEVESATLYLENGKLFTIKALNQSPKHVYVQAVHLNGKPLEGFILKHQDILAGGELVFTLSEQL